LFVQGQCTVHPIIRNYFETFGNESKDKNVLEFDNIDSTLKNELLESISLIISGNINRERIMFLLSKIKDIPSEDGRNL